MTDIKKTDTPVTKETKEKNATPEVKTSGSALPKVPTGTKMSLKGKYLIGSVVAVLIVYLIWALFGLTAKAPSNNDTQESTTISSNDLQNQTQQGQDILTQVDTQAYGTAGASMAASSSNGSTPTASLSQGGNLPPNVGSATVAAPNNAGYSTIGSSQTQDPQQQAMQNGMQSGLTPDGFQSSSNENNSPAQVNSNMQPSLPTANPVSANSQANANSGTDDQNMQSEKNAFLQNQTGGQDALKLGVQSPSSSYMVMSGSIIPATLVTGINSDLPGEIQAIVSQNVYDSKTGNFVLIPQGSKLIGTYDSQVAYGQNRVLIVWTRVIFPNDQFIDLEGMPGADLSGFAGLHDQVDNHYFRIYGSALLMSLFSAGMQLSQPNNTTSNGAPTNQQIIAGAMGQQLGQTSMELIEKNINIQPTINIRPGDNFNVLVTRDIPFTGPYNEGAN